MPDGPGLIFVFSGPSGSGKTTLLNIIGCIDRDGIVIRIYSARLGDGLWRVNGTCI